jgi:hypothetical protein
LPKTVDGLIFHGPLRGKLQDSTVLRNLKDNVIAKLKSKYPTPPGELGFEHGKVRSMRHYFYSESFRNGAGVGHRDSKMVAHYRHLRPDDSKKLMSSTRLLDLNPGQSETDFRSLFLCGPRFSEHSRSNSRMREIPEAHLAKGLRRQWFRCTTLGDSSGR